MRSSDAQPRLSTKDRSANMTALEKYRLLRENRKVVRRQKLEQEKRQISS
ncbi:hypothetical protein [Gluconobacter cerinus]